MKTFKLLLILGAIFFACEPNSEDFKITSDRDLRYVPPGGGGSSEGCYCDYNTCTLVCDADGGQASQHGLPCDDRACD